MNNQSLQIAEVGLPSSNINEFQAVIIIFIVAIAVIGMFVIGVRRARRIKAADQKTHDRVEKALHNIENVEAGASDEQEAE